MENPEIFTAQDFVTAKLYDREEDVIKEALRYLIRARPELRIQIAIYRYLSDDLSLAKAANLAGVSWMQMKDILLEKGIQPKLGVETVEEAENEIETLHQYFKQA